MSSWLEELENDIERLEDEVEKLKEENKQIQLAVVHKRFTVEDTVTGKQLKWWGAEAKGEEKTMSEVLSDMGNIPHRLRKAQVVEPSMPSENFLTVLGEQAADIIEQQAAEIGRLKALYYKQVIESGKLKADLDAQIHLRAKLDGQV